MLTSQHEGTEASSSYDDSEDLSEDGYSEDSSEDGYPEDLSEDGYAEDLSEDGYSEDLSEDDYHCICHGAAQVTPEDIHEAELRVDARNARNAAHRPWTAQEEDEQDERYLASLERRAAQASFLLH